ncbi:MAG: threonine--tRNA ligase [Mycoplasmatales bacterium]
MIKITFPDGNIKEYDKGITLLEIAKGISPSLAKKCVAGKINDKLSSLIEPINEDVSIVLITQDDEEAIDILNHSTSHLLAHAVSRIYKDVKLGVGPSIENGFYHDFDLDDKISEFDLEKIEKEMKNIVSEKLDIKYELISIDDAKQLFKGDEYKQHFIEQASKHTDMLTLYTQGEFKNICRGPHLTNTSQMKHFKLLSVAGSFWLGDANNKMLQRVYGTAFFSKEDLDNYLFVQEEAKKRDHRKLGKELELFFFSEYGPGFPIFLENGMIVKNELLKYWQEVHNRENYKMIQTPIMLNKELWETSGHWFNYKENMYLSEIDKHEFAVKPMNCPGGMLTFKNKIYSYKDLPLKLGELGIVHRHEASGALHGLFRVRVFTQDDAHIFCKEDQLEQEVISLIRIYKEIYNMFDLDFHIELSTKPDKAIGDDSVWELSEQALANACNKAGFDYVLNEGDGAFYGPKLDFKLKDSIGRIWQCGTIQLDVNLPERFDLTYIAEDGTKKRPLMLHRALLGSVERFMGIITEHYAGAFPTWLSPNQVTIIPVSLTAHKEYCEEIETLLKDNNIRVNLDTREEKLPKKIRDAQVSKTPYTLIIGDKEVEQGNVTYRPYSIEDNTTVSKDDFLSMLKEEISTRKGR